MTFEQRVKEYLESEPKKSFSYKDKGEIAKKLGLKASTVGWALWNLSRKGSINTHKKEHKTYFQIK